MALLPRTTEEGPDLTIERSAELSAGHCTVVVTVALVLLLETGSDVSVVIVAVLFTLDCTQFA
jgi:hypothetical protein